MRILFFFLFLFACAFGYSQPVRVHGHLKVKGTQLLDEHNSAVVLRGMSFGWHNFWPRFYNEEAVKWLANDWKCNVVRAAMGVEPKGGYLEDPKGSKEKIEAVIKGAIEAGIYVIVDWHSHNIKMKEAKKFFREIASKYGHYPNIIYELFNEPDYESWPEVKRYSEELIATIRSIDKDNLILVGNPHWDQDIHLVAADPIKNASNIMYTLHFYAATHKQWLRDRADSALKMGIPIFISESAGMQATGDGPINYEEWRLWIDWAEQRGLSWITWSVSDKEETCSVLQKTASSTGNWKETDLKESGIKARDLIRYYNDSKNSLKGKDLYPVGRTAITSDGALELISSASYFAFSYEGDSCQLFVSLDSLQDHNYLQYEIDAVYQKRIRISGKDNAPLTLAAAGEGKHTIRIYKATEAQTGPIFIQRIQGDKLAPIKPSRAPFIEFIGNSITCGAAADTSEVPCGLGEYHDQHNAYYAYGPRIARALGANFMVSSVSGIGVYRNWNSNGPTMPQVYEHTDLKMNSARNWDFSIYNPKIVSIALGTNDLSDGDGKANRLPFDSADFVNQYIRFVQLVKSKYPRARILLLSSAVIHGEKRLTLQNCLSAVKRAVDKNYPHDLPVTTCFLKEMTARGCSGHPSVEDHAILAEELKPVYQELLFE